MRSREALAQHQREGKRPLKTGTQIVQQDSVGINLRGDSVHSPESFARVADRCKRGGVPVRGETA